MRTSGEQLLAVMRPIDAEQPLQVYEVDCEGAWQPRGAPVYRSVSMNIAQYGDTLSLSSTDAYDTYCTWTPQEPEQGALQGTTLQLLRGGELRSSFESGEASGWSSLYHHITADGLCALVDRHGALPQLVAPLDGQTQQIEMPDGPMWLLR